MNSKRNAYQSWGRYPRALHQKIVSITGSSLGFPFDAYQEQVLAYGRGRSYGDSCLNEGGILIDTTGLAKILAFDPDHGVLRCEAGTTLSTILELIVPEGWFLPVVPGTQCVTVGGAIANDVHGKNHHRVGTFGCHIRQFELLRSTGERIVCSTTENSELYSATIAGMGLTGLITWVELKLNPISGSLITFERVPFHTLAECFSIAETSDREWDYTVAWLDSGRPGRGIFTRGKFTGNEIRSDKEKAQRRVRWPFAIPNVLLNRLSIRTLNRLYYQLQSLQPKNGVTDYHPFLFPLDALADWNRVYGQRGFFQYQCVVDHSERDAIEEIVRRTLRAGLPATLAVLKAFGEAKSPGMMSFPRSGITLTLDFPNRGLATLNLLEELDEITLNAKGAVYPAKDARMSAQSFQRYFPQWQEFAHFVDPKFSSSFWRRVTVSDP
ncbi:MAG TPA: FAD-binding oxidoreductase [Pyrinomonadaceae bacterium]